ncbi:MAG: SusC/RagA family TonB-linked outer membrane protein, partial [Bacteroidales bacterium]|nr:SusC/RagA family TonB-linked outer membrane protein [Bacteroidales bacterium]
LAGVYVTESGTGNYAMTGLEGEYTITAAPDATLEFSMLGFQPCSVKLSGQSVVNVVLQDVVNELEEVVVVGYGVQRKESVVGAISQVDGNTLVDSGNSNITNALAGKLSGVTTIQSSGQPGQSDAEIVIRGVSSFGSNAPLVLVDGVERDFSSVDPNEVQNISVLKDASATAVFGAKGANGVIIVTTKSGSEGKPKMSVSFQQGFSDPINTPSHIDSYTTMSLMNVAKMNDQLFSSLTSAKELQEYRNPSTKLNSLIYPDVDWFKEMTRAFAPSTTASFSITGGTEKVKYYAMVGYNSEGSIFKGLKDDKLKSNYTYNRFNFRTNVDFNFTKSTKLQFKLGGSVGIKSQPTIQGSDDAMWMYIFGSSTAKYPMYYPSWVLDLVPDPNYPDAKGSDRLISEADQSSRNPYYQMMRGQFSQTTSVKLFTDLVFTQGLDFITEGLSFQAKVSLSTYYNYLTLSTDYSRPTWYLDLNAIGTESNPWRLSNDDGYIFVDSPMYTTAGNTLQSGFYTDLYYDFSINYARTFGNHSVTALFLFNRQEQDKGTDFPYYNEALVARATYDYKHKYLVEFNMGYTGSERFAPQSRFGFFPSGAVGWVVSEEPFFQCLKPWFSKFKLRYSEGLVGSDYAAHRWLYISQYSTTSDGYIQEDTAANTAAQWEQALKRDLGVELGFFNGDLRLNVDLFNEHRTKMLISVNNNTPIWVGNTSKELNKGEIKKHGFEIDASYSRMIGKDWRIYVGGNFSASENRILYYDDAPYALSYQRKIGSAIGAQNYGLYTTDGQYLNSVDDIHSSILPVGMSSVIAGDYGYLDYNSDGKIDNNDLARMEGSLYPPISYAFNFGFSWRKLDFKMLFSGNAGKYSVFDCIYEWEFYKGNYELHKASLDYWTPSNQTASHPSLHYSSLTLANLGWSGSSESSSTTAGYTAKIMGASWRKSDFLRLKELSLSYTFDGPRFKKSLGCDSMQLYFIANNLLTFTDLIEGDPEFKYLIWGAYPMMRTFKLGFRLNF